MTFLLMTKPAPKAKPERSKHITESGSFVCCCCCKLLLLLLLLPSLTVVVVVVVAVASDCCSSVKNFKTDFTTKNRRVVRFLRAQQFSSPAPPHPPPPSRHRSQCDDTGMNTCILCASLFRQQCVWCFTRFSLALVSSLSPSLFRY